MASQIIFQITQRTEDNAIAINHSFPNPLIALDLLASVQKTLINQCAQTMEPKKECQIIKGESEKLILT
jgi:hypothetical protein